MDLRNWEFRIEMKWKWENLERKLENCSNIVHVALDCYDIEEVEDIRFEDSCIFLYSGFKVIFFKRF